MKITTRNGPRIKCGTFTINLEVVDADDGSNLTIPPLSHKALVALVQRGVNTVKANGNRLEVAESDLSSIMAVFYTEDGSEQVVRMCDTGDQIPSNCVVDTTFEESTDDDLDLFCALLVGRCESFYVQAITPASSLLPRGYTVCYRGDTRPKLNEAWVLSTNKRWRKAREKDMVVV